MRGEFGGGFGGGKGGGGGGDIGRLLRDANAPKVVLEEVNFRRIFGLFKAYWKQLSVILLLALTAAIIGLLPPLVMKEIIDTAIPTKDKKILLEMVSLMVVLPICSGLLGIVQSHLNNTVGQSVMRDLRRSLFQNLQKQSMSFFTNTRSGEMTQRLTGDVQAVQGVVTGTIVTAITQIVVIITTIIILFNLDWRLSLLSMIILPLYVLPVRKVSQTRKRLRLETQKVRGEMSSHLAETFGISGAMLTRIFGREMLQEDRFTNLNQRVMTLELKVNLVGRWFGMLVGVLTPLGTAIIYLYGGFGVMSETMTLGSIIAFAAYVGRLYGPVSNLLNLHVEMTTAMGIFQRIFEYLDMKSDIVDTPDAKEIKAVKGKVAFRDVSFCYQTDQYASRDVSFDVLPGQIVALVGPSGAGKSTLIGMIGRLHDPTSGSVEIDGRDIKRITLASLRKHIAFVTQESFLFHASIRDNLLFSRDDATDEEVEEACRKAFIHNFIVSLPEGYDTMVGERGHRLSGGERQRLAIARAILKNPRILILDEATSHLDSESEAYVQRALEELMLNRTTIVIAHRLSTVLAADQIVVMENGSIAEQGKHFDLLAHEGLYARLYHTQFSKTAGEIGA